MIIAFEGIDGAGKTTQSTKLFEKLKQQGYPVTRFKEPTNGIWGEKIRDLARNGRHNVETITEFEFFYNDRIDDVKNNILPSLNEKKIVVMDRYYPSSVAYQGARGLETDFIEKKNEEIAPKPDILIILDLEPKVALDRITGKRNETPNHFERRTYLENVRKIFLDRFKGRPNVLIIDGNDSRSIQIISRNIWKKVEPIVKKEVAS